MLDRPVSCQRVVNPIRANDGCKLFAKRSGKPLQLDEGDRQEPIKSGGDNSLSAIKQLGEIDDRSGKKDSGQAEANRHWGYHLLIDCSECNENINSNEKITGFFDDLVAQLRMKKLGPPEFRDVSDKTGRGVTAVQFITTSHITIHSDDDEMSAYIDVFSCAPYKPEVAVACVKKWFAPKRIGGDFVTRDAGPWPEK